MAGSWCLQKLIQNDNVVSCLERKIILLAVFIGRSGESKVPENLGCSGYGRRPIAKRVQFWRGRKGWGLAQGGCPSLQWLMGDSCRETLLGQRRFGSELKSSNLLLATDSPPKSFRKARARLRCSEKLLLSVVKERGLQDLLGALPALGTFSAGSLRKVLSTF